MNKLNNTTAAAYALDVVNRVLTKQNKHNFYDSKTEMAVVVEVIKDGAMFSQSITVDTILDGKDIGNTLEDITKVINVELFDISVKLDIPPIHVLRLFHRVNKLMHERELGEIASEISGEHINNKDWVPEASMALIRAISLSYL